MTPRTCACGALAATDDEWSYSWGICARCAAIEMREIEAERNEEWYA